jgi:hypothetical protein
MESLWTWGGKFFGHRDGDDLWAHDGHHVGRFQGDEVYGPDGLYLGELMDDERLITSISKKSWRQGGFTPYANRVGFVPYVDFVGYIMYAGYEDFPSPEELHKGDNTRSSTSSSQTDKP